jgi:hypothetical protein
MSMDDFEALRKKLSEDPRARAAFNADILALLKKHGIDTDHPALKDKLAPGPGNDIATARCHGVSPVIIVCDDD